MAPHKSAITLPYSLMVLRNSTARVPTGRFPIQSMEFSEEPGSFGSAKQIILVVGRGYDF